LKREKILAKLERIVKTVETEEDLPLRAKEIYVFGSTLWKDELEDLDLILIHEPPTGEEIQITVKALFGYGTLLCQKMNRRLKRSNTERIQIIYGTSLEDVLSTHPIGYCQLYWSRAKGGWRGDLNISIENLREAILKLRERIDSLQSVIAKYQLVVDEIKARNCIDWKELLEIQKIVEQRAKYRSYRYRDPGGRSPEISYSRS